MCGIAGQIGRDPRVIQGQYAAYCAMQQTLSRRGPDQRGMFISGRAALIHARLAVVDIENGLQPMQLDWQGESYTLVYNGELYNTPELRTALQNKGHSFTGHSDTEVLLHAFARIHEVILFVDVDRLRRRVAGDGRLCGGRAQYGDRETQFVCVLYFMNVARSRLVVKTLWDVVAVRVLLPSSFFSIFSVVV